MRKVAATLCLIGLLCALPALVHAQAAAPVGDTDAYLTNILRVFMNGLRDIGRSVSVGGAVATTAFLAFAVSQAAAKMALRAAVSQYIWQFAAAYAYAIYAFNAAAVNTHFAGAVEAAFSSGSEGVMRNPSQIMTLAYTITTNLLNKDLIATPETGNAVGNAVAGVVTAVANTGQALTNIPLIIAVYGVLIGYWWTAVTAIRTVVEANIKVIVGTALMPMLVLPITRNIGERGIGLVLEGAFELAAKSCLITLGFVVLQRIDLPVAADFQQVLQAAAAALAVAIVCSGLGGAISFAITTKRAL